MTGCGRSCSDLPRFGWQEWVLDQTELPIRAIREESTVPAVASDTSEASGLVLLLWLSGSREIENAQSPRDHPHPRQDQRRRRCKREEVDGGDLWELFVELRYKVSGKAVCVI